jgi:hypothetical protein
VVLVTLCFVVFTVRHNNEVVTHLGDLISSLNTKHRSAQDSLCTTLQDFHVGDGVEHARRGAGVVVQIEHDAGRARIHVKFHADGSSHGYDESSIAVGKFKRLKEKASAEGVASVATSPGADEAEESGAESNWFNKIRIGITFIQIIASVVASFSVVQWPENYQSYTGVLSIVGVNPAVVVGPSCIDETFRMTAGGAYLISLLLSAVVVPIVAVAAYFIGRYCRCTYTAKNSVLALPALSNGAEGGPRGSDSDAAGTDSGTQSAQAWRSVFFFWSILYPGLAVQTCQLVQPCLPLCAYEGQPKCVEYLSSDLGTECGTAEHRNYTVLGWASFVLLVLGFPAAIGAAM